MLDIIKSQIKDIDTHEEKINRVREFLQIIALKIIYERGFFNNLSFVGGTALRLLYGLRRFSENLDFSLTGKRGYSFDKFVLNIKQQLKHYGLEVDLRKEDKRTVHNLSLKFKKILFALGLSDLQAQKLFVRIEIDANPPEGWNTELSLINRVYVFTVTNFDLPSLYATKLHACFFRKYIKGRDFYDLLWYIGKRIEPNFELLNNAIYQTEGKLLHLNENNFKKFLLGKLSSIDFSKVRKDVERFLEDKEELKLLDKDIIIKLVK